jgi:sugar O-acyltransferase (sialic acid O-acetyltransferase NeuD family)
MEPIILIGGGGHCISCIDVIEKGGYYEITGILDLPGKIGQKVLGYPIIGTDDTLESYLPKCKNFLITVGQIDSHSLREKIFNKVKFAGGKLPVIVSPLAYMSKHAEISEGTVIMHNVLVNAGAKVGKACIINTNALIEHEAEVGDFCHISTSAIANGQVKVGSGCFIGSNTVIGNNTAITDNVVIAAGSQVLKDVTLPGIYIGNPLRKIR